MARTTIRTEDITASEVTTAKMATDPTNASNLSSGSVPLAQLGNVDTSGITANADDIALLGFKVAANGSLARYNLVDQSIDAFEDASGVDASASTNETRNAAKYYSGSSSSATNATGGTVTTSGGNTINTFTADGTFTTPSSGTVSYLVVGGGGAGVQSYGGGGGGGGMLEGSGFSVAAGAFSIDVGAGGSTTGADGANSTFSTVSAGGGGGGGGKPGRDGLATGGSGGGGHDGGGGGSGNGTGNAGAGAGFNKGSGGGGRGSVGGSTGDWSANKNGGPGGAGYASSISGASVYYAAGGGGGTYDTGAATGGTGGGSGQGTGGSGGNGGDGWDEASATAGATNTGSGGGGGGGGTSVFGAGADGVVIISYTTDSFTQENYLDMTLVSNAQTAQSAPTTGDLVITYTDGAGTATVNTDIKAYISRDGSAYTSAVTLASQGTTGGHTILTANNVDLSGIATGTSMRWKIETLNQSVSKQTRIQAVSLGWS